MTDNFFCFYNSAAGDTRPALVRNYLATRLTV